MIEQVMGNREYVAQEHSVANEGRNLREGTIGNRLANIASGGFFGVSVGLSITMIVFTIIFLVSFVEGSSMMTTLNPNWVVNGVGGNNTDSVVVNRYSRPERGNIIVVRHYHPQGGQIGEHGLPFDFFVKRMIAMDGDFVYFYRRPRENTPIGQHPWRYEIHVNGQAIDEWYLDAHWGQNVTYTSIWNWTRPNAVHRGPFARFIQFVPERNRWEISVPAGYMFYMGDNRGGDGSDADRDLMSWDSASFGPQPMVLFVGVVSDILGYNDTLIGWIAQQLINIITLRFIWGRWVG
ncbi:MAG: S26 family signal peptidase [Firmicutes bacterium]|nr:S26 family signal peptidase [Bacillota bacterium]